MPLFTPKRFQPPYYPMEPPPRLERWLTAFERAVKGALFGCRMCGNCILQETAFICPMACPKGLRNGPCGGSTPERCYVDPTRPCVWYKIYERSERMGRMDRLLEIQAPLDGRRMGRETWLDLYRHWRQRGGLGLGVRGALDRRRLSQALEQFFYEVRQPDWWQGDDQPHPPAYEGAISNLEARLKSGAFVVTAEIAPPRSSTGRPVDRKAHMLSGYIDAANFIDGASATPRMSSLASALICLDCGVEPVLQMTARDRTRITIQADALGASALGIRNILCISGDHPKLGPAPMTVLEPLDVDSIQMLWILRRMRDEGRLLDGRTLKTPPRYFLGAAASPYASNPRFEALRMEKKINAGAQFFQSQPIYDFDTFERWLEELDKRNLLEQTYILAGVAPLHSAHAAHYLNDHVPGVVVPQTLIDRMERAADPAEEGVQIALEIIDRLRHTPGISGIHIMAVGWESIVPRLIRDSGIERVTEPPVCGDERPQELMPITLEKEDGENGQRPFEA
ncbi:MAG: hypothetical protein GXP39_01440 [Chloroflexi bacterium]|nr:hypothetical protein [Chloroflexota bacterium]